MKGWRAKAFRMGTVVVAWLALGCRSSTPDDLAPAQATLGYVTQMSFMGGQGAIVLDDGSGYAFDVEVGAKRYQLSIEARQRLLKVVDDADFFDVAQRLHNNDILDGSTTSLFVATPTRQHWSENYMADDSDFAQVATGISEVVPVPAHGSSVSLDVVARGVKAYLSRADAGQKTDAVSRWLGKAEALIATSPLQQQPHDPEQARADLAALLAKPPAPGKEVSVVAVVARAHSCPSCPANLQCKPCDEWWLLEAPLAAGRVEKLLLMQVPSSARFAPGQHYRFRARWVGSPTVSLTLREPGGGPATAPAIELSYLSHVSVR